MIAESRNFLVRLFAPALSLAGAVLLLAGLAGNSEAQDRTRDTRAGFTLEFAGDTPDYHSADLCARLSGGIVQVTVGVLPACTKIDTSGTFCIAGSREVFPCRGLYRTVLHCNQYNRPARNPFVCEGVCSREDEFACGRGCWRGGIQAAGRIPYVAPGHVGDVFQAEVTRTSSVTITSGEGRFSVSSSPFTVNATNGTVGVSAALSAGGEYAGTLSAKFVCGGLWKTFDEGEWAFTVTALAAQPVTTIYLEGRGGMGTGIVTINGIGQLNFEETIDNLDLGIGKLNGKISVVSPRPTVGAERTFYVGVTSPELAGVITLTVVVKFRHPFDSDLGASHCSVPDDSDYQALRQESCSGDTVDGYCPALDDDLLDALETKGVKSDSDFCAALRSGADVNALDSDRDYPYPMAAAAKGGSVERGRTLTLHGASDVNGEARHGDALNYAALAGETEFAEWLIVTVGATVNRKSGEDGTTPLFHARTAEMVDLLVSAGVSVNLAVTLGATLKTALDAMIFGHDAPDNDLSAAISRLGDAEGKCLAVFASGDMDKVALCPNKPSCGIPQPRPGARYESECKLECPANHGGTKEWPCPANPYFLFTPGRAEEDCENRAITGGHLSCP